MVIVTGGAGFIGSATVWALNKKGIFDIVIVDNLGLSDKWRNLVTLRYKEYIHKDDFLNQIVEDNFNYKIEAIIHLGACSSTTEKDADYLYRNNFLYTKKLSEYCLNKNIRFIYASSGATFGAGELGFSDDDETTRKLVPINMYGYSKHLFDLYALENNLLKYIVGLKFFNVYGPNEYHKKDMRSVVTKAYEQILTTGKLKLFRSYKKEYPDGGQMRDFIYIKDVVEVILFFLENPQKNGLYNLGTGKARTWNDLARAVFSAMERPVNIEYIDMPDGLEKSYQYFTEAKMEKLKEIGYRNPFYSIEEGVEDYVKNYLRGGYPYLRAF